ncbi:MAG: V-type ATP synthase subunit F [Candidatus Undinarchaeales archaeon]
MNTIIIGDKETVTGFRLAGISSAKAVDTKNINREFKKAVSEQDIIIITEEFASHVRDKIEELQTEEKPVIIEVPGKEGSLGHTKKKINELIKRVVGMDMSSKGKT